MSHFIGRSDGRMVCLSKKCPGNKCLNKELKIVTVTNTSLVLHCQKGIDHQAEAQVTCCL